MATVTQLAARLQKRAGFARVSAEALARHEEAIISAAQSVVLDGIPGVSMEVFTAKTFSKLESLADFTHVAGDPIATTTTTLTNVFPGDVLIAGSRKIMVRKIVDGAPKTIHFGAPEETGLGSSADIVRRSIQLPNSGRVASVRSITHGRSLDRLALSDLNTLDQGTPGGFMQQWSEEGSNSILSLWPAPNSAMEMIIEQAAAPGTMSSSTELSWPDELLDHVLQIAIDRLTGWTPAITEVELAAGSKGARETAAARDSSESSVPIGWG